MRSLRLIRAGATGAVARPLLSAIVFLAVAFLSSQARAQHCGSYVSRPGDEALAAALGLATASLSDPAEAPTPTEPAPVPPCDGPACSKAPAAPSPAPAPPAPPSIEHWAIAASAAIADLPALTPLPRSEGPRRADRMIGGIFHPPRPA